jgi:NAD(P)-dependent dehydrogenase (short-subunit alcohol dehydrogenase family)
MAGGTLAGKVAIITGGGRGVGQGIALALGSEGASVVISGRTQAKLDETVTMIGERGGEGLGLVSDVTDADAIDQLVQSVVDRFGSVNILVNNAQDSHGLGMLLDVSDETFLGGFVSGPLATLRLMRACHPYLKGDGVIINFGTGASLRPDPIGLGCYGAIKEATRALTRAAAVEWGRDGIRVHTIVPASTSPAMEQWTENNPKEAKAFFSSIPLQRLGDPEDDIGRVVVFLCGADARYLTGNTVCIDGGQAFLR